MRYAAIVLLLGMGCAWGQMGIEPGDCVNVWEHFLLDKIPCPAPDAKPNDGDTNMPISHPSTTTGQLVVGARGEPIQGPTWPEWKPAHSCGDEPCDVPAIKGKAADGTHDRLFWCNSGGGYAPCGAPAKPGATCSDKSRILMTAEDGKKYCHKPQTD
jgi:hypothetical protein